MKQIVFFLISIVFLSQNTWSIENTTFTNEEIVSDHPNAIYTADSSTLVFNVEVAAKATFYMNTWMVCAELDSIGSGRFVDYKVSINGCPMPLPLKPQQRGWHKALYVNGQTPIPIVLQKGENKIQISSPSPIVPEVEKIFLTQKQQTSKASIAPTEYDAFINGIKEKLKKKENMARNIAFPSNLTNDEEPGIILPNPKSNYFHHLDVPLKYTVYKHFYLTKGDVVSFVSWFSDYDIDFDFIMDVYSMTNPMTYSWSITSNDVGDAIMYNFTIPYTDRYIVRVRSCNQADDGIVNLSVSTPQGNYAYNECPVTSTSFTHYLNSTTVYNYFTCNSTADTRLLIESDGNPGRIVCFNDYYENKGDFDWGWESRINQSIPTVIKAVHVSAAGTSSPIGTCDLYIMCKNYVTDSFMFPSLKNDDAMVSGPATGPRGTLGTYNCIAWAGGISDNWVWPPSDPTYKNVSDPTMPRLEQDLQSFDSFFGDANRYGGATAYTREGATEANAAIALWFNPVASGGQGAFVHASVRRRANNNPHGYDWESKTGGDERIFHPKDALQNDTYGLGYGHIAYYYRPISSTSYMSLEESVAEGKTIIETIELTDEESLILEELQSELTPEKEQTLQEKYEKWASTWEQPEIRLQSNPERYAESEEYNEFIAYCRSLGDKSWPFVFQQFSKGDFFAINAIQSLTDGNANFNCDKNVLMENGAKTNDNTIVFQTKRSKTLGFIKKYIKGKQPVNIKKKSQKALTPEEQGITYSNSTEFTLTEGYKQIAFDLPQRAKVSLQVKDLYNNIICTPLNGVFIDKGKQAYDLEIPIGNKGLYLVVLTVNGNINVKKILIQ